MNPVFLTLRPGTPQVPPNGLAGLSVAFPRVVRVRLLAREDTEVTPWADALQPRRVSVDIDADARQVAAGWLGSPLIRQVRLRVRYEDAGRVAALAAAARPSEGMRPVVFLLPASALLEPPGPWAEALATVTHCFVNPLRTAADTAWLAPTAPRDSALASWQAALGPRLFLSLPTEGATASVVGSAPCPAALGMHVFLDLERSRLSVCDCADDSGVPWAGDEAECAQLLGSLHEDRLRASEAACAGCPLWERCRGGCPGSSIPVVQRDAACPWPPGVEGWS